MSGPSPIDRLYNEFSSIIRALGDNEPSLSVAAGDNFRKTLVLAAASYFEYRLTECLIDFVREKTNASDVLLGFVKNKAISRQYHTWFKWEEPNANLFFGLFGAEFKRQMVAKVKAADDLRSSIQAFLEIGNERNKLIHQDFASFSLEKTLEEIYSLYKRSLLFVDGLATHLREFETPPAMSL